MHINPSSPFRAECFEVKETSCHPPRDSWAWTLCTSSAYLRVVIEQGPTHTKLCQLPLRPDCKHAPVRHRPPNPPWSLTHRLEAYPGPGSLNVEGQVALLSRLLGDVALVHSFTHAWIQIPLVHERPSNPHHFAHWQCGFARSGGAWSG